jgi:hypothetical protein
MIQLHLIVRLAVGAANVEAEFHLHMPAQTYAFTKLH